MRGEYDEQLKWPLRGRFTIQLLSQEGDKGHHSKTVTYNDDTLDTASNRVVDRERAALGWGYSRFSPHNELAPKYLRNDCLKFCVNKVE